MTATDIRSWDALVVDDEPVVCEAIRRILESEGLRTATATDVRSGLAHPAARTCRLLICDLLLPDRSGIELVAEILAVRTGLPIVMITGYATPETFSQALAAGVRELLPKPFDDAELLDAVRRAMDPAHARR